MRTKSGLPKGCVRNTDRGGKRTRIRFRDRKTGFSAYLSGTPWSEDFMRQYAAALDGSKAKSVAIVGGERTVSGTVNALIIAYKASTGFKNLSASTRKVRSNTLERFRAKYGDLPVKGLTRKVLTALMGEHKPTAGNNMMKIISYLLDFAIEEELIDDNPARNVERNKIETDGWHAWSEEEAAQYLVRHPTDTRAGLALALLLYTAQRRSDVVKMGWQHVTKQRDEKGVERSYIRVKQQKTKTPLLIPIHPELQRVLDALPRKNMTFLVTERGAAFSAAGFGNWMRDRCDEAELPHCSAHGLRKLAATRLANIGCTDEEIMAITGHRSRASLAPYTKTADQVRLARQAMAKFETNEEQERSPTLTGVVPQRA